MRTTALSLVALAGLASASYGQSALLGDALSRVYPHSRPALGAGGGGGIGTDVTSGPDIAVGEIQNSDSGSGLSLTISPAASNTTHFAYGLGTTSCNMGNVNVQWQASPSNLHPVIPQNMYRLSTVNGASRFEQVGQSWVKHAFTALTQNACLQCNGSGGSVLGIGCSDPYTASRNAGSGSNSGLGPRYHINPFTGYYPAPFTSPPAPYVAPPAVTDTLVRRLRVLKTDLAVTSAGSPTQFFGECVYVNEDDARWGNGKNNVSYRRMFCTNATSGSFTLEGTGGYNNGMHRQRAAIYAWQDYGSNGTAVDSSVIVSEVTTGGVFNPGTPGSAGYPQACTGDGWIFVASKATDLGNGQWHYEYAVENLNSDRGVGAFTVPVPAGATITNVAWHGVDSHGDTPANDATRNAPWVATTGSASQSWASPVAYDGTGANQFLGNYVRWGTLYNFRFDSNAAPVNNGQVTLGFYKPMAGWPDTLMAGAWVPGTVACYANCDSSTDSPALNVADFTCFLARFSNGEAYANCDGSVTAPVLNVADFSCFMAKFGAGCP
jgi:hypothetical protein